MLRTSLYSYLNFSKFKILFALVSTDNTISIFLGCCDKTSLVLTLESRAIRVYVRVGSTDDKHVRVAGSMAYAVYATQFYLATLRVCCSLLYG